MNIDLIDSLSNHLEQKGLIKEAMQLDIIANTIEKDKDILEKLIKYIKDTKDDWNYITPEEFEKMRKKGKDKDFYILDIRKPDEYKKGHIPGAKNIFWLNILDEENLKKLPKNKKILLYCYVGHTSSQVMVLNTFIKII